MEFTFAQTWIMMLNTCPLYSGFRALTSLKQTLPSGQRRGHVTTQLAFSETDERLSQWLSHSCPSTAHGAAVCSAPPVFVIICQVYSACPVDRKLYLTANLYILLCQNTYNTWLSIWPYNLTTIIFTIQYNHKHDFQYFYHPKKNSKPI